MIRVRHKVLLGLSAVVSVLGTVASARAQQPVRIVTFNVQCLQAPDTRATRIARFRWTPARLAHLESVANVIEALEPDVCALVEVTSSESIDRLVQILHDKGLNAYQGYHVESQDKFTGFDVGFITRVKLDVVDGQLIQNLHSPPGDDTWREKYSYTDDKGEHRDRDTALSRHALIYLTLAGRKVALLGLHLKSDPSDNYSNARRSAEATIAARIVRSRIVERGYLPIVVGDINDYDPDVEDRDRQRNTVTHVVRTLKDYDPDQEGDELVNAARHIKRADDRYTSHWDFNENGAADEGDVYTMLDYILLPRSLETHLRRTFVCRLTDLSTSDHWPLVVDLVLPEPAQITAATRN